MWQLLDAVSLSDYGLWPSVEEAEEIAEALGLVGAIIQMVQ